MRGCENPLWIDQSPAAKGDGDDGAEGRGRKKGRKGDSEEGDLPRRIPQIGILSSHNLGEVAIPKIVTTIPSAGLAHCKKTKDNRREFLFKRLRDSRILAAGASESFTQPIR